MQGVDQARGRDDGRAVLVVMEDRYVHQFAQAGLDDEAFGRADILEIDAAEGRAEIAHRIDEGVRILGRHLEIDRIDVGEALEENGLALHHGFRRERAEIAEAQYGGAVRDDGDEVALGRIIESARRILRDRQHRHGDAGRIGERQIALRRHGLRRHHLDLAGAPLGMEQQGLLVGEARPGAARNRLAGGGARVVHGRFLERG